MKSRKVEGTSTTSRRISGTRNLNPETTNQGPPSVLTDTFRGRRPNGRLLYLLPLLLIPGLIRTFASGRFFESLSILAGFALLYGGAFLIKRGILDEAKSEAKLVALPSRFPNKNVGAAFYGLGIAVASAFVARYGIGMGMLYGLVTAAAIIVRYGPDKKKEKSDALKRAEMSGIDVGNLLRSLEEAKGRIASIRHHGGKLEDRDFRYQTVRIADLAEEVIDQIEKDPRDVRSSRKFLISYLKRAEEVVERFAAKKSTQDKSELKDKFAESLNDLETVFRDQNAKLLANDSLDLEVKLDVLSQRLKSEGAG